MPSATWNFLGSQAFTLKLRAAFSAFAETSACNRRGLVPFNGSNRFVTEEVEKAGEVSTGNGSDRY